MRVTTYRSETKQPRAQYKELIRPQFESEACPSWRDGRSRAGSQLLMLLALTSVAGCYSKGEQKQTMTVASELPCAVDDVLGKNCRLCHKAPPLYGAPMPLVTWADLQETARSDPTKKVYELVSSRIHDSSRPMPPTTPLVDADIATLDAWIAGGRPKAATACGSRKEESSESAQGLGCEPDQRLAPSAPWSLSSEAHEEYVCYGVDVTTEQKRHVIAIGPRIQNPRVVHHLDLFQSPESFGPEPQSCSPSANASWRMVYTWAPGGKYMILPPEAGFPLENLTHYVVQLHYSNPAQKPGERDGSGLEMCTTSALRANDADVMAFGSQRFSIPAHSQYQLLCSSELPQLTQDIHFFGVMPHMHNYGKELVQTLVHRGGDPSIELAAQLHWDTGNQTWFGTDAVMHPGDHVETRCGWANTSERSVPFGDNAADEMCYAFTMYYPRMSAADWNWAVPAKTSTCTPL